MKRLPDELHNYFKNNVEYQKGDGLIIANILKENNIDIRYYESFRFVFNKKIL